MSGFSERYDESTREGFSEPTLRETKSRYHFCPECTDEELVLSFDRDARLDLDIYAALWERGLICYSDKGMKALERAGER